MTARRHVSHTHIRAQPEPPPPVPQVAFGVFTRLAAFTCLLLVVIAVAVVWHNYRNSTFLERYQTVDGTVSEVRIVVDRVIDAGYGGGVLYKTEAHVLFTAEGKLQDRWLLAAEPSRDTSWLKLQIPASIKKCIVYWVPGHLDSARCRLK
jgi:hypothetical protein